MKCRTCGFAASDAGVTVCPFCQSQGSNGGSRGGLMPAYAAQTSQAAAVWPPAPTAPAPAYAPSDGTVDREALKKQRQLGVTLSWCGFGVSLVSRQIHGMPLDLMLLLSLSLYCIGYGHYAASKGYARWIGWLLSLVLFGGGLILKLMPDKNRQQG